MADGDTVFGETRVRGNVIPLDSHNLGSRQQARQVCDRRELASSVFEATLAEVNSWPEVNEEMMIAQLEAMLKRLKRQR